MTPQECCAQCPERRQAEGSPGAYMAICLDGVPLGMHWDTGYCPLSCFGTCAKPTKWEENPKLAVVVVQSPEMPVEALTDEERIGLGDLLEAGIKAVKLDLLADLWSKATGLPCGCEKRKEWLNRIASWKKR